jgi:hypothetical protein
MLTPIDKLSRALCQTFSGDSDRLMDGLFTIPYQMVTNALDPNLVYYFDAMATGPEGQQQPQVKNFRFWGFQAIPFMEELINNDLRITDLIKEPSS